MPIDAAEAMTKANANERHRAAQVHPGEVVQVTRVRPIIDRAGKGEEERADDAVREHLQNRARNPEQIAGRQAKQNKTHVADARIADDEFEIVLAERDRCRVNNPDDGEDGDPFAPHLKA